MSDWAGATLAGGPVISTHGGINSIGPVANRGGSGAATSAAWPTANKAIFVPCRLFAPKIVYQLMWSNGTVVSGNIDIGFYDTEGNRLISSGSGGQSGTNAVQVSDTPDTTILVGNYYLAIAADNTTSTLVGYPAPLAQIQSWGVLEMASAFPLPATATFAALSSATAPVLSAYLRSLV